MQLLHYYRLLLLLGLLFCLLTACEKRENIQLQWTQLTSGTEHVLWSGSAINQDTIFVCGGLQYDASTILKTENGGQSWRKIDFDIGKVVFDMQFLNEKVGFITVYDGKILRTNDGGETWSIYQMQVLEHPWQPLRAVHMVNDTLGFVVGGLGYNQGVIMRTVDGGDSWQNYWVDEEMRDVWFTNPKIGYACGYGVIYKTLDGGDNWFPLDVRGDFFTSIFFPSEQVGYAVGNQGLIVKTENAGHKWFTIKGNGGLKRQHFERVYFTDNLNGYVVGRNVFWRTKDGGDNWQNIEEIDFEKFNSIILLNNQEGLIVGEEGCLVKFSE